MATSVNDLTPSQYDMVYEWLRAMGMPVGRRIHRDYSDGVLVAKLMKKLYPRLLDEQTYPTYIRNDLKIINWQTLQYKVLTRIGLPLTRKQMYALACSEHGALEKFLYRLMQIATSTSIMPIEFKKTGSPRHSLRSLHRKPSKHSSLVAIDASDATLSSKLSPTSLRATSPIIQSNEKLEKIVDITEQGMVPFSIYEGVINEVRAKENTIKAFKNKVAILERLIQERDSEIQLLKHKNR